MSEWGNPHEQTSCILQPIHNCRKGTRGTETSKYPEEKKENSIPLVVASEKGRGQTRGLRTPGVAGRRHTTIGDSNVLESTTRDGDSPVGEAEDS